MVAYLRDLSSTTMQYSTQSGFFSLSLIMLDLLWPSHPQFSSLKAFHLPQPSSTFRNTVFDLLRPSWTFIDIPRSRHPSAVALLHPGFNLPQIHSIFLLLLQWFYPPDFTNFFLNHH
jgi:hypothetical protein